MSSVNTFFNLRRPFPQTVDVCGRAVASAGWKVQVTPMNQPTTTLVYGAEPFGISTFFKFHYPAELRCVVQATGESECMVNLTCSNMGFGPLQSGYVKKRLDEAVRAIKAVEASIPS